MIEFLRYQAQNLCSYRGYLDIPLDKQGIVLLTGVNGSGKSTPWYGITKLLYNWSSKRLKHSGFVNVKEGANFWHCLDVRVNGITYRIEESIAHEEHGNSYKVSREGEDISPRKVREARELAQSIIGMDLQVFLSTIVLPQEGNHILVEGTPKEKHSYLMWLFGLSRYEELHDKAKTKINQFLPKVRDIEQLAQDLSEVEDEIVRFDRMVELKRRAKHARVRVGTIEAEQDMLQAKLERLTEQVVSLRRVGELTEALGELNIDHGHPPTSAKVEQLEQSIESIRKQLATIKEERRRALEVETLRKELEAYEEIPDQQLVEQKAEEASKRLLILRKIEIPKAEEAKSLRKQLAKITTEGDSEDLEEAYELVKKKREKIAGKIASLSKAIKKGLCPTCKRPWSLTKKELEDGEATLQELVATSDRLTQQYHLALANFKSAKKRDDIQEALKGLPIEEPSVLEDELAYLTRETTTLKGRLALCKERQRLETLIENAPKTSAASLRKVAKRLEASLADLKTDYTVAQKGLQIINELATLPQGNIKEAQKSKKRVAQTMKDLRKEHQKLSQSIITIRRDMDDLSRLKGKRTKLERMLRKAKKAKTEATIWGALKDGFIHLLKRRERELLESLTRELPPYLYAMFGEQASWLKVQVKKDEDGVDLDITARKKVLPKEGPSPGMKAKIGLAAVFALRSMLKKTTSCNLLVLDEPLQRIDDESRAGFLDLLNGLKDQVGTIILISHDATVKGGRFDQRWHSTIENGVSTLERE